MARKNTFERRSSTRAKRYTPRPHPEVTERLEAVGLSSADVYRVRRWDKSAIDLDRLGAALHSLTVDGWRVAGITPPPLRYVGAYEPRRGADPLRPAEARQAEARLTVDRARGLAFVFDRSPDAIEYHLTRHRGVVAALGANPIQRLAASPEFSTIAGGPVTLSKGALGALASFVSAFGKFHAAVGNAAFTVSDGAGVPMTDEARAAAQAAYLAICARILSHAGTRPLSACQDLAANRGTPDRWLLAQAAAAIDPEVMPATAGEGVR